MTEQEWLCASDPDLMLEFIHRRTTERKLRLFCCACCRAMRYMSDPDLAGIQVAELYADGIGTEFDLEAAEEAAAEYYIHHGNDESYRAVKGALAIPRHWPEPRWDVNDSPHWATYSAGWAEGACIDYRRDDFAVMGRAARKVQADRLRDVIGNPFQPVAFDSSWRTPEIHSVAETMYESRSFDRMPELADRLEAAGCTEADVLDHCRGPGPHVRGCWVIDGLLGKS